MASTTKPNCITINSVFTLSAISLIFFLSIVPHQTLAKSRRPISDFEIREQKNQCYADIESGLWGLECKSSMIAKENCALRCLSPTCYELVYEGDPLEEGEKDYTRGQEYKFCIHNDGSLQEIQRSSGNGLFFTSVSVSPQEHDHGPATSEKSSVM